MASLAALRLRLFNQLEPAHLGRSGRPVVGKMLGKNMDKVYNWYPQQPSLKGLPHLQAPHVYFKYEMREYRRSRGLEQTKKGAGSSKTKRRK